MWAFGEISAKNWDSLSENQVTGKGRVIVFLRYKALKINLEQLLAVLVHIFIFEKITCMDVFVHIWLYICAHLTALRGQNRVSDPLGLEL